LEEEFEAEQERIKQEIKRKQEEEFILRQAQLTKMGAAYQEGSFVLNDVSYEAVLIKESDDEVWEVMKKKFYDQFVVNEATRLEEEKKKEEAAAELLRQQQEQERKRIELEQREAAIKLKEQEEADRQKEVERQQAAEHEKKHKALIASRINQIQALGMSFKFDDNAYSVHDVFVASLEITTFTDEEWAALIEKITPVIEERKQEAEQKRLAAIEEEKRIAAEAAVKKEQERVAEEKRKADEKRIQDEAKKAEDALKATDKTKWASFLKSIEAIQLPDMKHPSYKQKIVDAKRFISKINDL
jgi:unconventional prefoldin RPB5 interactor 1